MALAIPEDGLVVACEINDDYVQIAKPFFKEVGEYKLHTFTKFFFFCYRICNKYQRKKTSQV